MIFLAQPILAFELAAEDDSDPTTRQARWETQQATYAHEDGVTAVPGAQLSFVDPPAVPAADPPSASTAPAEPAQNAEYFTLDELRGEMKKLAWTKGDFTITPYGILWSDMAWETARSVNGDYVLYVQRPRQNTEEQFHLDARSTRLGFDVLGPKICAWGEAQTGGKVEIDFQRIIDTENRASVLLRHAYLEVKSEDYRLLMGQTWDVISPLYPGVLFYTVGWDGGNIGYRRAQARAERHFAMSDALLLTAQGSLNVEIVSDISSATPATFVGDHSGWPLIEGRIASTFGPRGQGCHPVQVGVSGHIGETTFDFRSPPFLQAITGSAKRTWSLNTDIHVPISSRFGVQGELWMGQNLATFFGGIGQGADVLGTATQPPTGDAIFSRGGWVDVWYDWTPRLHSHAGYSIDDPIDADVTSGRIYNAFVFANLSYDVTQKFLVGFEFTSWRTLWKGPSADAPDQHFDFVAKYGF